MSKRVVFMTVMDGAPDTLDYKEWCFKTWSWWCKKNDVQLFVLDQELQDKTIMKPTWQRWHVFEVLEANGIECDQVALVDIDTMIRWDAPNFFDTIPSDGFGAVVDDSYIEWTHNSIKGYKHLFPTVDFDWTDYFNCGFIVLSKEQKELCKTITDFYYENEEHLRDLQHNTLKKGSDQTPVNYLVRREGHTINYLNKKFNTTHLHMRGVLQGGLFVECGYIWHFNGFEKTLRNNIMRDTWNIIKENYND